MNGEIYNQFCSIDDISAYLDAELDERRERELLEHCGTCSACAEELNRQKQFLRTLESSLKHDNDLDLPADFTRHVVANAESTVAGLRRPRERFNAVFICAALMLFILFALGADAGRVLEGVAGSYDQAAAVGSFFGHFVYSFFLGVAIVLRGLATQVRPEALAGGLFSIALVVLLAVVSQRVLRAGRA